MESRKMLYETLRDRIKAKLFDSGDLKPGDPLPASRKLIHRFGGSSRSIMKAMELLESDGLVVRLSPRKFAAAVHPLKQGSENSIGLINFGGDVYSSLGSMLIHSAYSRNIFSYSVNLSGEGQDVRTLERFFSNSFNSLFVHDQIGLPLKAIESHRGKFGQLIFLISPYNRWNIPFNGVFLDLAFPMYDGLLKLCESGCRNIQVLNAVDPPGCDNPRDFRTTGINRFFDEGLDRKFKCKVSVSDYFELAKNDEKAIAWAKSLDYDTDAILGAFDFFVVNAQCWIKRHSKIDWQALKCLGQANSSWSKEGPNQFASYDFRLEDITSMAFELLDSPPKEPLVRRIHPKLMRKELLS